MKHKHHIIPKHAGGTDDPDNLIELSIIDVVGLKFKNDLFISIGYFDV